MAKERTGLSWLLHQYTNLWVEGLRFFMGDKKYLIPGWIASLLGWPDSSVTEGKDMAYIVGHIIVYLHIPAIIAAIVIAVLMLT